MEEEESRRRKWGIQSKEKRREELRERGRWR
jgi:hypothetical protein